MALYEQAYRISSLVEIRELFLAKASFVRREVAKGANYTVSLKQSASSFPEPESNCLRVKASFRFAAHEGENSGANDPVEVGATFEARYSLVKENMSDFTQEHYDAFARTNGIFNAWPYFREFLQSSLVRMGLPAFALPVLRLPQSAPEGNCP